MLLWWECRAGQGREEQEKDRKNCLAPSSVNGHRVVARRSLASGIVLMICDGSFQRLGFAGVGVSSGVARWKTGIRKDLGAFREM